MLSLRLRGLIASAVTALALFSATQAAQAQTADCSSIGPVLQERARLMQRAEGLKKKRPSAAEACTLFSSLSANGNKILPWLKTNGEWCHVPAEVGTNIKAQHDQIVRVRGQACNAAAQQKKMEAQAKRQGGQKGDGPMFGGADDIVGGPVKMPQGAL